MQISKRAKLGQQVNANAKSPVIGQDNRKTAASNLSPRQKEIAGLVAQGYCDCEIAAKLGLSEQTVGSYLKLIYKRCGVHNRTALAACFFEWRF